MSEPVYTSGAENWPWRGGEGTLTSYCDECGATVKLVVPYELTKPFRQVDNGFTLDLYGHYGGFLDLIGETDTATMLCHNCTLRIMRAIPNAMARFGNRWHPYEGEPCCEWGWEPCPEHEWATPIPSDCPTCHGEGTINRYVRYPPDLMPEHYPEWP